MKKVLLFVLILIAVIPVFPVAAFPGDGDDEDCAALVDEAVEKIEQGIEVVQPDCMLNLGLSALDNRAAQAEMERYSAPNVIQVEMDPQIVYANNYKRLNGTVEIYDAPNGNVVNRIEAGYNYVTIIGRIEGWTQIRAGQWVKSEVISDADVSEFAGVEIPEPLERPFAWMLAPARPSVYPGGPEHPDYEKIKRYSLLNIYGIEIVDGWEWYLVGENRWIQQIRVAKIKPIERPAEVPENKRWVAVDLFEQTAVAYEGNRMVFATLVSSGLPQWSTYEGVFQVYQRWTGGPMTGASGQPDFYYIEKIPYIMYFNGDIALHGTYWHDRFGYRQSHGCVNLSIMDAKWFFDFTAPEEHNDTFVYVYSSDDYRSDLPGWAIRPRK